MDSEGKKFGRGIGRDGPTLKPGHGLDAYWMSNGFVPPIPGDVTRKKTLLPNRKEEEAICAVLLSAAEVPTVARGPRELTGAIDLINHFKLSAHHDFFCKRTVPSSISDTHYLHNVVGEREIRKGEGMELGQLFQSVPYFREATARIQQFDLDTLGQAFELRDTSPIELPSSEKGIPTIQGKSKGHSKDKEKKHKKHKDKDKDKDKEHKKHKHRHKDRNKDKDREKKKDKSGHHDSGDQSKKHHEKKRKHDGNGDSIDNHKAKKSKHRSLKAEEVGELKVSR